MDEVIRDRSDNRKKFMALSVFWLRLDQIEEIMTRDYRNVFNLYSARGLLNVDLDYEREDSAMDGTPAASSNPAQGLNLPLRLRVKLMSKSTPKLW